MRQEINRVRINGGIYRSRWLEFPDAEGLRPTPDRVRETLFNWLGQNLSGMRCLDLFAGSGALGFEAISRGADEVVMVESNREAFRALQENCKKLACTNVVLRCEDGPEYVRRDGRRYDVIFLDPPFYSGNPHPNLPPGGGMDDRPASPPSLRSPREREGRAKRGAEVRGCLSRVLPLLGDRLTEEGLVYVESGELFEPGTTWQVVKRAKAGKVHYQLLRFESEQKL